VRTLFRLLMVSVLLFDRPVPCSNLIPNVQCIQSATDAELKKFAESIASQDRKGAQLEKQLETLRERADQAAVDAKELNRAFKTSEQLREQWQRQQDGASRSFRLELGAHLQQMEELLNDKVDSSRADVIRLGRSNVALCALVHQCRSRIQQLASAEEAAAEWRARLEAHAEVNVYSNGW